MTIISRTGVIRSFSAFRAACSLVCIQLSAVLFLGSLLFALLPSLWWADAVAAWRAVVASAWLPKEFGPVSWHGLFALHAGPGGTVYGATANCVFRIKPGTCDVERVWQESQPKDRDGTVWLTASDPNIIDVVGPIVGHELYFATGGRLRVPTLP